MTRFPAESRKETNAPFEPGPTRSQEIHGHCDPAGRLLGDWGLELPLLTDAAKAGNLRDDVAPDELASYCLHALTAAGNLPSKAAVRRLVAVILAGLRRPG